LSVIWTFWQIRAQNPTSQQKHYYSSSQNYLCTKVVSAAFTLNFLCDKERFSGKLLFLVVF